MNARYEYPIYPTTEQKSKLVFITQDAKNSKAVLTQQDIENHRYQQDWWEATKLEIEAKYGVIKPEGQKRLAVLQAKKEDFWQRYLGNTMNDSYNLAKIPVHCTNASAIQLIQGNEPHAKKHRSHSPIKSTPSKATMAESTSSHLVELEKFRTKQKNRKSKLKEIVWEGHLDAIAGVCKKHNYAIAIRETGTLSIERIKQGAKAKPHTILEKSIKESSLENPEKLDKIKKLDLHGFVGHWEDDELIGLRIDNLDSEVEDNLKKMLSEEDKDAIDLKETPYLPLDLEKDGGGFAIKALKSIPEWQKYLYTGDYDLHEAYSPHTSGQIPEASKEKVSLLTRLNNAIKASGQESSMRDGKVSLTGTPPRIKVEGDYAMFQHGDQATYRMNQHLEAMAKEAKEKAKAWKEENRRLRHRRKSSLVRQVALESNNSMAFCIRGEWFETNNQEEHQQLRYLFSLTPNSGWDTKEDQRTLTGKKRTEVYK